MKKTGFLLGALLATLVISAYQYYAARAANSLQISRDFQLAEGMLKTLIELERNRLETVARSLAAGPMLRSALQSGHAPTIESVLDDLLRGNQLASLTVEYRGKKIRAPGSAAPEFEGAFSLKVADDELRVTAGSSLGQSMLQAWKERTAADLDWRGLFSTLPKGHESWISSKEGDINLVAGPGGAVYYSAKLIDGLVAYLPRTVYQERLRTERNRLLFFALSACLALGLLSLAIERFVPGTENSGEGVSRAEWNRLLAEIEALKRRSE